MPRASRKTRVENTTPSWYSGPGRVNRRQDPPFKVALRGRLRKGK